MVVQYFFLLHVHTAACAFPYRIWARILVHVAIYRRLLIGRDGHLDQSEAYDISQLVREYAPSSMIPGRMEITVCTIT